MTSVVGYGVVAVLAFTIGALAAWMILRSKTSEGPSAAAPAPESQSSPATHLNLSELRRLFNAVPGALILVDCRTNASLVASDASYQLGLVQGGRVAVPQLTAMVGDVYRGSPLRTEEIQLRRSPFAAGRTDLLTRVVPIDEVTVLVLAEDVSSAKRVDDVRRDFVANVSHELKTPVGALSLLSEAILTAADDPTEVRHFADRMRIESARLAHLVADIVDLSRLQGDDPMQYAQPVKIDSVLAEAVDSMRTTAQAKEIEIVTGGDRGLRVFGVESQLVTAVRNLLANAVAYSSGHTRVAVGCRALAGTVEITVTDQGIGIPTGEIDRIFERFYRIDQARSRQTGGTGLGLSIVKHVCQNHRGTVAVWSVEGEGSTFTLQLPRLDSGSGAKSRGKSGSNFAKLDLSEPSKNGAAKSGKRK